MTLPTRARRRLGGRAEAADGIVMVITALVISMILTFVAMGIDLTYQVNQRQELSDTLDSAAHAGAYWLPANATKAEADAKAFALKHDKAVTPVVDFWCVVGSLPGPIVDVTHIPHTCNPGPGPYTAALYPGMSCNGDICAIPCVPADGDTCNTIRVADEKAVPYQFAPVIGIDEGSTGHLLSVACRGACGEPPVSPIDFVIVGDRTGSMGGDIVPLENAIKNLLEFLTPTQHRVALGTIGRSKSGAPKSCPSQPSADRKVGPWVPVGLSDDYDLTDNVPPDKPADLNPSSWLVAAVDCLGNQNSSTGTNLGDPIAEATTVLVANGRPEATKAILFMTDGAANEPFSNENSSCQHAESAAASAKAAGIVMVTIAYRLEGVSCGSKLSTVRLAAMASDAPGGGASSDDGGGVGGGCNTAAEVSGENGDGDFFFCTPNPDDLGPIFETATKSLIDGIRFMRLPS